MREIKFRGKRIDTGEWVYGYFTKNHESGKCYITTQSVTGGAKPYEVIPETVGQYTGLCDKNGKQVFKGDIVEFIDLPNGDAELCIGEVIFEEFGWHFTNSITESGLECYEPEYVEVIGNIHDNPLEVL